ncbi:hypothetical protein ALC53_04096 [Atta colombica]|uniref:Uncharacterized protein n=1 Tax=Atta colombica TaxID=520822 RepID=A0A195BMN5_9HYME|nr:hypothetical protein ALC53_04096 [Atta colombica]
MHFSCDGERRTPQRKYHEIKAQLPSNLIAPIVTPTPFVENLKFIQVQLSSDARRQGETSSATKTFAYLSIHAGEAFVGTLQDPGLLHVNTRHCLGKRLREQQRAGGALQAPNERRFILNYECVKRMMGRRHDELMMSMERTGERLALAWSVPQPIPHRRVTFCESYDCFCAILLQFEYIYIDLFSSLFDIDCVIEDSLFHYKSVTFILSRCSVSRNHSNNRASGSLFGIKRFGIADVRGFFMAFRTSWSELDALPAYNRVCNSSRACNIQSVAGVVQRLSNVNKVLRMR